MAVLFELPDYIVRQSWWRRRLSVQDRRTGRVYQVPPHVETRLMSLFLELRQRSLATNHKALAATFIEQMFVACCVDPRGIAEDEFFRGSPTELVDVACLASGTIDLPDFETSMREAIYRPGQWREVFNDGEVRLEIDIGPELLRATAVKSGRIVEVSPAWQAQHQAVIAAIRAAHGEDNDFTNRVIWLWTRSFCRAVLEGPRSSMASLFFTQDAAVVADMIAALVPHK